MGVIIFMVGKKLADIPIHEIGLDNIQFGPLRGVVVDSTVTINGPAEFTSLMFDFNLASELQAFSSGTDRHGTVIPRGRS